MAPVQPNSPRRGPLTDHWGTLAEWATAEAGGAILGAGEFGGISDTYDLVIGDTTTKVATLPRVGSWTFVAKADAWFNVKDYGAVGDGITDDTAAINACFNAALGGAAGSAPAAIRYARGMVYFPVGTYKVTSDIVVTSAFGLIVRGAGRQRSRIMASGSFTNVVSFIGCPELLVQDLTIGAVGSYAGGSTASGSALALDFTPAQSAAWGARGVIERVSVADLKCKYGISLGLNSDSYDLSDVSLRDCHVEGSWTLGSSDTAWYQAAFMSGSGTAANVLNHSYDHASAYAFRHLLRVDAVNSVLARNVTGSGLEQAFDLTGPSSLHVYGGRIESSRKLLKANAAGDMPNTVTVETMVWAPATDATLADRLIVQFWAPGSFTMRGCVLEKDASTTGWQIQPSTSAQAQRQIRLLVENCVAPNATAESLFSVPTGSKVRAEVRFLVNYLVTTGFSGTYVTKRLLYNGATADDADATITT